MYIVDATTLFEVVSFLRQVGSLDMSPWTIRGACETTRTLLLGQDLHLLHSRGQERLSGPLREILRADVTFLRRSEGGGPDPEQVTAARELALEYCMQPGTVSAMRHALETDRLRLSATEAGTASLRQWLRSMTDDGRITNYVVASGAAFEEHSIPVVAEVLGAPVADIEAIHQRSGDPSWVRRHVDEDPFASEAHALIGYGHLIDWWTRGVRHDLMAHDASTPRAHHPVRDPFLPRPAGGVLSVDELSDRGGSTQTCLALVVLDSASQAPTVSRRVRRWWHDLELVRAHVAGRVVDLEPRGSVEEAVDRAITIAVDAGVRLRPSAGEQVARLATGLGVSLLGSWVESYVPIVLALGVERIVEHGVRAASSSGPIARLPGEARERRVRRDVTALHDALTGRVQRAWVDDDGMSGPGPG